MARRSSFASTLTRVAREAARRIVLRRSDCDSRGFQRFHAGLVVADVEPAPLAAGAGSRPAGRS